MYQKYHTHNGLTVVVSPMPHMASVSLGIWVGVGGRYESDRLSGISHLVEHILFKGTEKRSAKELKEAVEGIGGAFNGFTSDEVTCYMVKVPAKYLELGMDILSDMVLNARFDEEDIAKEKYVVCEEIKMYRDQPSDHVQELLGEILWKGDALGRPLTGTISGVKAMKKQDLIDYKEASYHPANIAVVAAGNVDPDEVLKSAKSKFSGLKNKKKPEFETPVISQKSPRMKYKKDDIKQTHIAMGFHALDSGIHERFSHKIMNMILGGNMSSRLFEELREKRGLCYDIASVYKKHRDVGDLTIHSGVDNKNALRSTSSIIDEIKKMKDTPVQSDELSRAKEYTKGQFLLAIESTSSRMQWLGERVMGHKNIPDVKNVLKEIDRVSAEDVKKSARKIFDRSSANLAMIGSIGSSDENRVRKELDRI